MTMRIQYTTTGIEGDWTEDDLRRIADGIGAAMAERPVTSSELFVCEPGAPPRRALRSDEAATYRDSGLSPLARRIETKHVPRGFVLVLALSDQRPPTLRLIPRWALPPAPSPASAPEPACASWQPIARVT